MKKLLIVLGSISLIGINVVSITACNNKKKYDTIIENVKSELGQYIKTPFFASSSNLTNKQLASELSSRIMLGDYKLIVKNDINFILPKIIDNNIKETNTLAVSQQQKTEDGLSVINGNANVSILKKNKETFNIQIQWNTNEILLLTNTVNKINNISDITKNINLPLPQIMPGFNLTFADLYFYIDFIPLPEKEIKMIDLNKISDTDFINKFDNILDIFATNIKNNFNLDINSYLDQDISFKKSLFIVGEGTVRDILHNIAPDLIAFLQWFITEGKEKIKKTHNIVLPLIQYLLSPINDKIKKNIKNNFGNNYLNEQEQTNLDSLILNLLVGYKNYYKKNDSRYKFKFSIFNIKFLNFLIDEQKIKNMLSLKPTLLIGSILNAFAKNDENKIDIINTNLIDTRNLKGINNFVINNISIINFFLEPSLMNFAGSKILHNLGISNTELMVNNVTISSGMVLIKMKNKNGQWENFSSVIDNNNKINLLQILDAIDFKFSFSDVKFKITAKNNNKLSYESNGKNSFDLWLSDMYY